MKAIVRQYHLDRLAIGIMPDADTLDDLVNAGLVLRGPPPKDYGTRRGVAPQLTNRSCCCDPPGCTLVCVFTREAAELQESAAANPRWHTPTAAATSPPPPSEVTNIATLEGARERGEAPPARPEALTVGSRRARMEVPF